jgi:hypothetical protein
VKEREMERNEKNEKRKILLPQLRGLLVCDALAAAATDADGVIGKAAASAVERAKDNFKAFTRRALDARENARVRYIHYTCM